MRRYGEKRDKGDMEFRAATARSARRRAFATGKSGAFARFLEFTVEKF